MGAQCATAANSSLLSSVRSLLPMQVALRDLEDRQIVQWTFMTGMLSPIQAPQRYVWQFWKAPGHSDQGSHWTSH